VAVVSPPVAPVGQGGALLRNSGAYSFPKDRHEGLTQHRLPKLQGNKAQKGFKPAKKALVLKIRNIRGLPEHWPVQAPLVGAGAAVKCVLILEPEMVASREVVVPPILLEEVQKPDWSGGEGHVIVAIDARLVSHMKGGYAMLEP